VTDDTYVHEPDADRTGTAPAGDDGDSPGTGSTDTYPRNRPSETDAEFDWRGWLLVGAVVTAFLIVPGILYLLPTARGAIAGLGLGLRHTYLVLPLVPAFLLGLVAVWSAVRSRSR
jgi:hypothetical protein